MRVKNDALSAIAYFDMFDYPITQCEVLQFSNNIYSEEEIKSALLHLTKEGQIFKIGEFYSLQQNECLAARRQRGNQKAERLLKTARRVCRFLNYFPYVRGIAISGSLSKNFADDQSDVDLFILTAGDRLWISRTILFLFRKLAALIRKEKLFCMNYLVDESALEINEKNIFTAIEIASLIPMQGKGALERFYAKNQWVLSYLPNAKMNTGHLKKDKFFILKRMIEKMFNNRLGDFLESYLMRVTASRYAKKEQRGKLNKRSIVLSMVASRHCSKMNPKYFQFQLIERYNEKLDSLLVKTEQPYPFAVPM